jgi:hypothetical protein
MPSKVFFLRKFICKIIFFIFSNTQLKQIFDTYQQFSGVDIEQTIKIDTDADLSRTLMAIGN